VRGRKASATPERCVGIFDFKRHLNRNGARPKQNFNLLNLSICQNLMTNPSKKSVGIVIAYLGEIKL